MTDHSRIVIAPGGADRPETVALLRYAARRGFRRAALPLSQRALARGSQDVILIEADRLRPAAGPAIPLVVVRHPEDSSPALRRLKAGEAVAVRWTRERVIPLENLVAARRSPGTLWVVTDRIDDLPGFLGALEHGADHIVVRVTARGDVDRLEALLEHAPISLAWARVPVVRVASAGLGDRVIVDTTSMLRPDEGLLVGSAAALLLHVASEAVGSRFTRPRPFRVNAGAAHLYTLLANGETRYLSELVAGDAVLLAHAGGGARAVRVGRIKIERRPLTLVEVRHASRTYTAFLQEAETVRLSTARGPVPTTDLRAGVRALAVPLPPARHLGTAVTEAIEER